MTRIILLLLTCLVLAPSQATEETRKVAIFDPTEIDTPLMTLVQLQHPRLADDERAVNEELAQLQAQQQTALAAVPNDEPRRQAINSEYGAKMAIPQARQTELQNQFESLKLAILTDLLDRECNDYLVILRNQPDGDGLTVVARSRVPVEDLTPRLATLLATEISQRIKDRERQPKP